jgi:hypothetical protein
VTGGLGSVAKSVLFAIASHDGSLLPRPIGERGGVREYRLIGRSEPTHPRPLPDGERERAVPVATAVITQKGDSECFLIGLKYY